jgi:4-amino-4-deoxy-L-arabinose transferase-like glycosyltransferase
VPNLRRTKLSNAAPTVVVLSATAVLVALHVFWLHRFRFGFVTEWDESGYLSIALHNTDALRTGGPFSLVSTVIEQGVQAPLVPLSAVPFNVVFGDGVDAGLLAEPAFFALLVLSTYGVACRLVDSWWAVLSALAVATAPVVSDYTRIFHFSVPAAALFTSALWALLRSEGLNRRSWAIGCGLLLGLMVLSRSMTIAYLPGFAIAAVLPLVLSPVDRRRRLLNFALLCICGGALAALWYGPNLYSVGDYLLNFGYGAESSAYGAAHSPLSIGYWTRELGGLVDEIYLPLGAVLLACLAAAVVSFLLRGNRKRSSWRDVKIWLAGSTALTLVVVIEGYVALTSSRNQGTAFALPWLPALVVIVVAAVASIRQRPLRLAMAGALAAVSLFNLTMKSGFVPEVAGPVTADLPALGKTTVVDGRGLIQLEVADAGYPTGGPTDQMPPLQRLWLPFAGRLARWSFQYAERHGQQPALASGFDDPLLSNTRIALGSELALSRPLTTLFLKPFPHGDSAASYRSQLQESHSNLLITGQRGPGTPGIRLTRPRVEAGAHSLGFKPIRHFLLPDGRELTVWWRGARGGQGASSNQ